MKLVSLFIAGIMLTSLSLAKENKKTPTLSQTTKKGKQLPRWMKRDSFDISTVTKQKIHLLSTKKGFTFDKAENKITLLVVWNTTCKSCTKWLKGLQSLKDAYPGKLAIITLEMGNTHKKELEKLTKEGKADKKSLQKIITKHEKALRDFAKKENITLPIVATLSNPENLDFTLQTLYKFQFAKPRGKAKRGGGLPFTIVFGYHGETLGITAGISDSKAYKSYISKLIQYSEKKKKDTL